MSAPWFKFPISYWDEPRMYKLRRLIGESALWLPARLWSFAVLQDGAGDLSSYGSAELAEALKYKGKGADRLLTVLKKAGYVDDAGTIVGFKEMFALAKALKTNAANAAKARWEPVVQDGSDGETKKKKKKEKEGGEESVPHCGTHAPTPTLSLPPPSLLPAPFSLSDVELHEIAAEFRITPAGTAQAARIFREIKTNYPKEPQTLDAFNGWLRITTEGKRLRALHPALTPPVNPAPLPDGVKLEAPADWAARLWGWPGFSAMSCGITDWDRLSQMQRHEVIKMYAAMEAKGSQPT